MKTYRNPVLYADYSDPDVIQVGSDYYMVASSFSYVPGVPLLHSKDLVHWEIINYCVKALPFEKYKEPSHGSGTWAPSIRFHEGIFIVFIPLVDEGILVARSDDPYGEFQLNMLCERKGWIDPCPYWDEAGKAYMVFAYAGSRAGIKHRLMLVEINADCRYLIGEPQMIFDGEQIAPTTEGPKLYKKNGYYYILMPSGGVENGWQSCLRSRDIWGPYEYRIVMRQGNSKVNGPHQGAWITSPDGKDWFIHFQDVNELGRILHLEPMCFLKDWPFIGQDKDGDGIGEPVEEWRMPVENMPEYKVLQSDEFESEVLGLQWQWQANPNPNNYSLSANPGCLRLYCRKHPTRDNLLWYAPNALTQIPQSKSFTMTAELVLHGEKTGDFGGIGMIGHIYSYMGLYQTEAGTELRCYKGIVMDKMFKGKADEECVLKLKGNGNRIWLKLRVLENKTYRFSYSWDGEEFLETDPSFKLCRATWTGARPCLWACARENAESEGSCDYKYISIRNGET